MILTWKFLAKLENCNNKNCPHLSHSAQNIINNSFLAVWLKPAEEVKNGHNLFNKAIKQKQKSKIIQKKKTRIKFNKFQQNSSN